MISKSIQKIVYISVIITILIFTSVGFSYATSQSELQQESQELDKKIAETNTEIAGVKSQMSQALTQINKLNTQITSYENDISDLEVKIKELEGQITEKQNLVNQKQIEFDEKTELLGQRIVAMYESGTASYLDVLLNSESFTDFLSKYYIIDQLVEADQNLLETIEEAKNTLEAEKQSLETNKQELESSKETIQAKSNALTVSVNDKNRLITNLTEEEKELEQKLEEFRQDQKLIQAELEKYIKDNGGTVSVVAPSAAGYICPIPGKTKAGITTGYYDYKGHTGVDFACKSGTSIVAVKSGTVVTSMAKKNSRGNYYSYGEYIIIDHHDGTMTLYAHGSPGTRMVIKGDHVTQGQQIMKVGSTGNSTGPHLHFEVRVNARPVNPTPYLP